SIINSSGSNEDTLVRPKCSIVVSRGVHASKEQGRPYVITSVGVNGIRKSTNLAKISYWLQQHNISFMMLACTFRSGAVEQLPIRARKLHLNSYICVCIAGVLVAILVHQKISGFFKGRVLMLLKNYPTKNVQVIIVTNGRRIFGHVDPWLPGVRIPIGELPLYTALGRIRPYVFKYFRNHDAFEFFNRDIQIALDVPILVYKALEQFLHDLDRIHDVTIH
ncbi:hypothetical protein MKW98_027755, partial [Papaver atlanticum]